MRDWEDMGAAGHEGSGTPLHFLPTQGERKYVCPISIFQFIFHGDVILEHYVVEKNMGVFSLKPGVKLFNKFWCGYK